MPIQRSSTGLLRAVCTTTLNIDTLPVTMPKSDTIRSLTHTGEAGSSSEYSKDTVQWIKNVLSSDKTPYDDDFAVSDLDQAQEYERP